MWFFSLTAPLNAINMYSLLFLKAGLVLKGPPASIMAYESVFQTGTTGNTFTRLRMIRFKESSLSLVTFCWEENINHIWREKCVKHFLLCYLSKEARKLLSLPHNPAKKSISSYTCSFDDISGEFGQVMVHILARTHTVFVAIWVGLYQERYDQVFSYPKSANSQAKFI